MADKFTLDPGHTKGIAQQHSGQCFSKCCYFCTFTFLSKVV